jgi:signal transduction histidine kinase
MMSTLFAKLSAALLAVVSTMGIAFVLADRLASRLYHEELTQRLNAPIAMYVTGEHTLIADGIPDLAALTELASQAMIINPTAEIYLLDSDGLILGHALPPETVLTDRVNLNPVRSLIDGTSTIPVYGDDPRSPAKHKVFSASEVRADDRLEGYLYVVLGGARYEALASDIGGSYTSRVFFVAAAVIVAIALAIGLLVFSLLTQRLKALSYEMQRVTAADFENRPALNIPNAGGDEIDRLGQAFVEMSARIRSQFDQLKESDRLRRELVSNISHDLRTPLAAMQGYLETLVIKGDSLPESERDRYLSIARKHMLRLGDLVGDLFELSKLDSTSVVPNLEAFSVAELLQDISQEFQLEAENKGVSLITNLDTDVVSTIGDIGLIERVLENLVRNAIRFTPIGGEVTLSISERPQSVAVSVTDTGCGIRDEDLPRIFDRFYRSDHGEEARSDSSGLGLAIVKRILDLHDSRITVVSKPDEGTRFEFELRLHREAA